jgi:hypothetical protein
MRNRSLSLVALLIFLCSSVFSQVVYERHDNEVYNFLSRLSQKGIIVFNDLIRPISKKKIGEALDSVAIHRSILSDIEKKELAFYQQEYTEGVRKRIVRAGNDDFSIQADPIITASYLSGSGKNVKTTSSGINFWGSAGKKWGFQFSLHDINVNGTGLDTSYKELEAGSATGPLFINKFNKQKTQNFLEIRGHLSYEFKNGSISAGQDYLLWGFGENRIVLSDKAPTYPYIRFDYQPLPWLRFNYSHAFLQSGLMDSSRSYTIPSGIVSGVRQVDIAKFMASHSIDLTLTKGLNFTMGESVIYNDNLNIGYLVPVMLFKAVDNYNSAGGIDRGSNGQFFFQLSSRNQLSKTHLYSTLFIDEIRVSEIFGKKQRNQVGYTVGGSVTDIAGITYLTAGVEYTRIRPFVYRNFLPAQNYTHAGYLLGDWMGNNADRIIGFVKYTPIPKLKLQLRYSYIRKGAPGTLAQQYEQDILPPFLFDLQRKASEVFFSASYEYLHRLNFNGYYRRLDKDQSIFIGMTYGL